MFTRPETAERRQSRTDGRQDNGRRVDVVLLVRDGPRFVLRADGNSLAPLTIPLVADEPQSLRDATERAVRDVLRVQAEFLGVLAYTGRATGNRLLIAMVTRTDDPDLSGNRSLRLVAPAEIRSRRREIEDSEHLEAAHQLLVASRLSPDLHSTIRRAMTASITHLDDHLSVEGERWGWNQYQDGSELGTLSTGEALMTHVHAGVRGAYVDLPAETLEAHQNPDGGWQVRRSLVVAPSALSITESTCSCLLALASTGRGADNEAVRRGLRWLEEHQKPDNGWSSSAMDPDPSVFPTTMAIRALAAFGHVESAAQGVAWLRAAQCSDGGWGAHPRATERGQPSAPAYTAYAVVALLAAGVQTADGAVGKACEYLRSTFEHDRPEPWAPISFNSVVDPGTSARLEYRHFATPWALAALCLAGADLGDPLVAEGTRKLLDLQNSNGTWRCGLMVGSTPVWATHDAVFALAVVLRTSDRSVAALLTRPHLDRERAALHQAFLQIPERARPDPPSRPRRGWVHTAWMSVLTVGVALVALAQFGVLQALVANPGIGKLWPAVASVLVTAAGAIGPSIAAEEYKIRRRRSRAAERVGDE